MQPELLEQINTNYFKAEALCWGFSECSWWSFIASFVNSQCELLSLWAEQRCSEERESPTVLSHHPLQHPCTTSVCSRVWNFMDGFHALSLLQDGRFQKTPVLQRQDLAQIFALGEKIPSRPLQEAWPWMRRERSLRSINWMLVPPKSGKIECSWISAAEGIFSTFFHQGRCFTPFTKAAFPWPLTNSFIGHSSCSLQPWLRPESYQWSKLSLQSTHLFIGSPLILKMNFQGKIALIWQPDTWNSQPSGCSAQTRELSCGGADVSHLTAAQHSICRVWNYPYPKQDHTTEVIFSSHPKVFFITSRISCIPSAACWSWRERS